MKLVSIELHEEDALEVSKVLLLKASEYRNPLGGFDAEHRLRMRQLAGRLEHVADNLKQACYNRRRHETKDRDRRRG